MSLIITKWIMCICIDDGSKLVDEFSYPVFTVLRPQAGSLTDTFYF